MLDKIKTVVSTIDELLARADLYRGRKGRVVIPVTDAVRFHDLAGLSHELSGESVTLEFEVITGLLDAAAGRLLSSFDIAAVTSAARLIDGEASADSPAPTTKKGSRHRVAD